MTTALQEAPNTIHIEGVQWCELTSIGLKVNRKSASFEEMQLTLERMIIAAKGSPLAVGDAMCIGETKHGDKWAQAVDVNKKTGIKVKTLLEYRRVSENVPFSIRLENENLEWSHYQVIANRPHAERARWVELVAEHGWSIAELKKEIKEAEAPAINSDAVNDEDYLDPHYKQFLLDYIVSQYSFKNRCTYEPFKQEIEKSIRAARYQHKRTLTSDYEAVREQVNKLCTTPLEIAEEVPLSEEEIQKICHLIVDSEPAIYEWRPIGVDTDVRRGALAKGIFRKDAPHYEGGASMRSNYEPTIDWE